MRVITSLSAYPADGRPSVVAQGTFDGIHLGHQAVIRTAVARARALGVEAIVLTFDPHPVTVLRPAEAPPELLPLAERLPRLAELGPDTTLVVPFTPALALMEAEAFAQQVLVGLCRAREVVVGFNHTFGRGARGTPALLLEVGAPLGLAVHVVPPLLVDGVAVSSSSVREALRHGDVRGAAALLGRPYAIQGVVGRGAERGRTLGFPTANVGTGGRFLPADGVYAGRATWDGSSALAVINVGVRPTFGAATRTVEAYLLEVDADLYGHTLALAFLDRIRPERRFPSVDALRTQIGEDVDLARRLLS